MDVGMGSTDYLVIGLYGVLAVTGFVGNAWVMATVLSQLYGHVSSCCMGTGHENCALRRQKLGPLGRNVVGVQSSACVYLLMLSVVDLISFVPVPLLAVDIMENQWPYGVSLCKLLYTCEAVNKSLSPLILTALSVDRYIAVCRPTFTCMRRSRFASLVILVCMLISLFFILPVTAHATVSVIADLKGDEHPKCVVQMSRSFDLLQSVMCYVLPLIFICSVYIAILKRLYEHTRRSSMARRTTISLSRVVKCSVMVVAFYFICWTPYWGMRIMALFQDEGSPPAFSMDDFEFDFTGSLDTTFKTKVLLTKNVTESFEFYPDDAELMRSEYANVSHIMLMMYLVHALPYTQSAFNWLFYAFLNKNLRQNSRCTLTTRSAVITSTPIDNGQNLSSGAATPLWKNIQHMGVCLKSGLGQSNATFKMSPFKSKRIRSRSTTCLETLPDTCRMHLSPPPPHLYSSTHFTELSQQTGTLQAPRVMIHGENSALLWGDDMERGNDASFYRLASNQSDMSVESQCAVRRTLSERIPPRVLTQHDSELVADQTALLHDHPNGSEPRLPPTPTSLCPAKPTSDKYALFAGDIRLDHKPAENSNILKTTAAHLTGSEFSSVEWL